MKIFAHRGMHSDCPENSIPAIQKAFENEILHVELDIRRCKTGEIIVFHDRKLKRMTGLNKFVINTPFSVIQNLHLKNDDGTFTNYHIPTLREVLEQFSHKVDFILDVKKETWIDDGLEWNLWTLLNDFGIKENVIISSFNPFVLKRINEIDSSIHTGLIVSHPVILPLFMQENINSVHIHFRYVQHPLVSKYCGQGKKIFTWTVNDLKIAEHIAQLPNIEAIITDIPDTLVSVQIDNNY